MRLLPSAVAPRHASARASIASPVTRRPSRLARAFLAILAFVAIGTRDAVAVTTQFATGTLIIPMDTVAAGQNGGMLRAYGLVYDLLRHDVPVSWAIDPFKPAQGNDLSVPGTNPLEDVRTGTAIAARAYGGGPFLIADGDAAAALPIIQAWQATIGDQTAVHRLVSASSITVDVSRVLVAAPRIAVLGDGNEQIAFNDLNAAGIPDGTGAPWTSASPDFLTEGDVVGPLTTVDDDGALFHQPSGAPRYCFLASMHYNVTSDTNEVVQEVRTWLDRDDSSHAFMQCEAAQAFENASGGLFLTTAGLDDDGSAPATPVLRFPASPLTQLHGTFEVDSGSTDSMRPNAPGFKSGVETLINENGALLNQRIVMVTGRLDGNVTNSRVTYLAGHDYTVDLPISANPQTNGVRLLLNALLTSDCAGGTPQTPPVITKTAPSVTNGSQIEYTVTYGNPADNTLPLENILLRDELPAGTAYLAGSATPAPTSSSGGVLTWALPPLAPGAQAVVTFSVSVTADGTYSNTASLTSSSTVTTTVTSAPAVTVRETVPPAVIITGGPTTTTNDPTPSFTFTVGEPATSFCGIDTPVPTLPCAPEPSIFTDPMPLAPGPHTFYVRATDAAGNTATVSRAFVVDIQPPLVVITGGPTTTTDTTPSFTFTVSEPATSFCGIDTPVPTLPCAPEPSIFTAPMPLAPGPHTFYVSATDDAGNTATVSRSFEVIVDADGDGFSPPVDCNDSDAAIRPDATEVCDAADVDEDCDGLADDADPSVTGTASLYTDADHDGSGTGAPSLRCDGAATGGDCDDGNPAIHPGATEVCTDVVDNDCNASADCHDAGCAADLACAASLCLGGPFTCKSPGVTQFDLKNASNDKRDKLTFRWSLGDPTTTAELGDPTVDTRYAICVWDDVAGTPTLVLEAIAPPGGNCLGRPCWRQIGNGKGFRYRDPGLLPTGIEQVTFRAGALGKSRLKVQGRGAVLPDAPMPFQQDPHVTVQVMNSLGNCWGAEYVSPARKNSAARLVVKERP